MRSGGGLVVAGLLASCGGEQAGRDLSADLAAALAGAQPGDVVEADEGITVENVRVSGSGDAFGAVLEDVTEPPIGWETEIERSGAVVENDPTFAGLDPEC